MRIGRDLLSFLVVLRALALGETTQEKPGAERREDQPRAPPVQAVAQTHFSVAEMAESLNEFLTSFPKFREHPLPTLIPETLKVRVTDCPPPHT